MKPASREFAPEGEDTIPTTTDSKMEPSLYYPSPAAPVSSAMSAFWSWITRKRRAGGEVGSASADLKQLRARLVECLTAMGGEVSTRERLTKLAATYGSLSDQGRQDFLALLASEFGPDEREVNGAIRDYQAARAVRERRAAEQRLRASLVSPRVRVLSQFNLLHDGVKFLVDMRADAQRFRKALPELEVVDEEVYSLFASWFDVGFLELRRISWSSPAALLEKLIRYEAVHEIRSWNDLRNRLDSDRRCYAFFHPRMPDEPLVFVQIALVKTMAGNVHELLDESQPTFDPHEARAAIFYSISNTQPGLRGVSFGGFLIKRVVEQLLGELPRLKLFATLSPLPGFRRWLEAELAAGRCPVTPVEKTRLHEVVGIEAPAKAVHNALAIAGWHEKPSVCEALEPIVVRLAARYLAEARENDRPIDPVARFHLGNGARLERVNWLADTSQNGLRQSAGVMVNYLYKLDEIEANHEAYARHAKVPVGPAVRRLLKAGAWDQAQAPSGS